ncbi:MAG: hypothetical protein ACP5QU_05180 [Anaerolineae bacterium]
MVFNMGEVLTRAWKILWKHKILWVFGFLASCGTGGGGNFNFRFSGSNRQVTPELRRLVFFMDRITQWLLQHWWAIALALLAFLLILLLTAALSTLGRIGLIRGVFAAEQETEPLLLGEIFNVSLPYFWRVFWLNLLPGLLVLFLLLPLVLFGAVTGGFGFLCLLPFFCLLIPLMLIIGLFLEQANRAIVLEDLSLLEGVQRGWKVFNAYAGPIILMGIVLFVVTLIASFILAIPLIMISLPVFFAILAGESLMPFTWVILAVLCLYLPVAWFAQALLVTYVQSAWTLTYLRLTRSPENPPVVVTALNA